MSTTTTFPYRKSTRSFHAIGFKRPHIGEHAWSLMLEIKPCAHSPYKEVELLHVEGCNFKGGGGLH